MKTATTSRSTRAPSSPQNATGTSPSSRAQDGTATPAKRGRKRKPATFAEPHPGIEVVDLTGDTLPSTVKKPRSQGRRQQNDSPQPERRARRWRDHPPQSYLDRLHRIRTQRFGRSLRWMRSCADASCVGCLSLAIRWAELTRRLKLRLISLGRRVTYTGQLSGRCQPAIVPMLQRATSASTYVMVSWT